MVSPPAPAQTQQDFLVFASVEGFRRNSTGSSDVDEFDPGAIADFLYTLNTDRTRLLVEYVWADDEAELERLHLAYRAGNRTTVHFGRFHSIANYWASEFHHGKYLQTSISRPGLEAWEDESGPLPSHITGMSVQHLFPVRGAGQVSIDIAAGAAPRLVDDELVPFDFLDAKGGHRLSVSGNLSYSPDVVGESQVGLLFSVNDFGVDRNSSPQLAELGGIEQVTVGAFADWRRKDWRLIANFTYFDIELDYTGGRENEDFFAGYVQPEYMVSELWTIFGRAEFASGEDDSAYLDLLPAFIAHRNMIGARWDFYDSHSLTIEIAETSTQGDDFRHDNFEEVRFQWSAVFP